MCNVVPGRNMGTWRCTDGVAERLKFHKTYSTEYAYSNQSSSSNVHREEKGRKIYVLPKG
jgi:hypothetical protein